MTSLTYLSGIGVGSLRSVIHLHGDQCVSHCHQDHKLSLGFGLGLVFTSFDVGQPLA